MSRHFGNPRNEPVKPRKWNNTEAPMDDVNGDFPFRYTPDPIDPHRDANHAFWKIGAGIIAVFAGLFFALAVLLFACSAAKAHMPDRPELNAWFSQQESAYGLCCSFNDSAAVADVDYDTVTSCENNNFGESVCTSHYRVRLDGKWILVPDGAVVPGPNLYGAALVWTYQSMSGTTVRCFRPGAGG